MVQSVEETHYPAWKVWKKRRYVVSVMGFCGFFNAYVLRVNLSIAIVAMTQKTNIILDNGTTVICPPEFEWSNELQGYIMSAFFYGYITTQLAGGVLATRVGGKVLFGLGVVVTAALSLITPLVVVTDVYLFIAVRVLEGFCEGVTYPCIHAVWSKWAPPLERSRLATIAFSGCFVGTVVGMPASAYLANALGWESVFYISGASGVIWFVFWTTFVSSSPEDDPRISPEEQKYIRESIDSISNNHAFDSKVPWKKIFTSMPVWAIIVSHFSENWGFYTLLTQLPKYLKEIYNYELGKSGFLSALPYLLMSILIQFSGQWADWLLIKGYLTTTQVRKTFNCTGFLFQTIFMITAALWSDRFGSVGCLTLAVGLGALAWPGFSVNHLDLAPQHASILMGISNTFATIPGIISPTITGYIVKTPATNQQWQTVFFIAAGIYLFGAIFYGIFAAGEMQPWAVVQDSLENTHDDKGRGIENIGYIKEQTSRSHCQDNSESSIK